VREAKEVERLGFPVTPGRTGSGRIPAELDKARFARMQLQAELREPLAKIREELLRVRLMLEPGNEVVREAHDDDITVRVAFSPPLGPPVKDIVEVDVRQ
jgi:hypothetical protein